MALALLAPSIVGDGAMVATLRETFIEQSSSSAE